MRLPNTPTYRPFGSIKKREFFKLVSDYQLFKDSDHQNGKLFGREYVTAQVVSRCRGSDSIPGQPTWYLWWTKWYWDRFCFERFGFVRQQRFTDADIQFSNNRRVAAVPRDLNLTPTVTIDPQQRHYRQVNTNVRSGLLYQLHAMKCPETGVFIIMCHMSVATRIAVCSHTQL